MTDSDLDEIFARYGVDTRLGDPTPLPERPNPPLSPVGERHRDDLLRHISRARAALEMMEAVVRDRPNDDASFDAIAAAFGENLDAARASFQRFRERRECAGES